MADLSTESFEYSNEDKYFRLILKAENLPSINDMYGRNRGGHIFLLPHVRTYKANLKEQVALADPVKFCKDWLREDNVFHLQLQYIIKHSFFKRDIDNFNKATQDSLFEAININDARIIEHTSKKSYKQGPNEYIIIQVSESDFDWQYFNE